jgi:hypothetical protein
MRKSPAALENLPVHIPDSKARVHWRSRRRDSHLRRRTLPHGVAGTTSRFVPCCPSCRSPPAMSRSAWKPIFLGRHPAFRVGDSRPAGSQSPFPFGRRRGADGVPGVDDEDRHSAGHPSGDHSAIADRRDAGPARRPLGEARQSEDFPAGKRWCWYNRPEETRL